MDESGEDLVTLYRAVGPNEAADIVASGVLRSHGGSMEGKWLAETLEDATEWGRRMKWGWDRKPFEVVAVEVPRRTLERMFYHPNLDGIGPAYYADVAMLGELLPGRPLSALPLRWR